MPEAPPLCQCHHLQRTDLQEEQVYLSSVGYRLEFT